MFWLRKKKIIFLLHTRSWFASQNKCLIAFLFSVHSHMDIHRLYFLLHLCVTGCFRKQSDLDLNHAAQSCNFLIFRVKNLQCIL